MNFKTLPSRWVIAGICVVGHTLAIPLFGAVFWIDSIDYGNLGLAMLKDDGLAMYYKGIGTWVYSHLQPGVSLAGIAVGMLPQSLQWPALAIAQHAIAALACFTFFATISRYWPSRWNLAGCVVLIMLPSYQAAHSSLMTESLNSSLMLFGLSQAICLAKEDIFNARRFLILLGALVLATQFRSYSGVILAGVALLVLIRHRLIFSGHALACYVVVAVAALAYPGYRFSQTGEFRLPSGGINSLMAGWWVNPSPSAATLNRLDAIPVPENLRAQRLVNKGVAFDEALALARFWQSAGMSDRDINSLAQQMGGLLRNDGWDVQLNRVALGLASSGMVLVYCVAPPDVLVFPGLTARRMCAHQRDTYLFQSWVDSTDRKQLFHSFFEAPSPLDAFAFQMEAKARLAASMKAYVTQVPALARDPLFLGRWVPPDLWVIAGIVAMLSLVRREKYLAAMCGWIFLSNFVVAFSFPLGNPRYAYALFPIYIGVFCVAASSGALTGRKRKSA